MSVTFDTSSVAEKREREESEATEGLDEQALAKKARKDARVCGFMSTARHQD
jgi:hypothetical protein